MVHPPDQSGGFLRVFKLFFFVVAISCAVSIISVKAYLKKFPPTDHPIRLENLMEELIELNTKRLEEEKATNESLDMIKRGNMATRGSYALLETRFNRLEKLIQMNAVELRDSGIDLGDNND